jgi:exodeoxyribonuclease-3
MTRIISWNVNGIRAVEKKGFIEWMSGESADVVCLQETKAKPEQLSADLLHIKDKDGRPYHAFWASAKKPGYSGVALYSKEEPVRVKLLGREEFDDEGRILEAEFKDFSVISAYFPNSQDAGKRLDYKLAFCEAVMKLCKKFVKDGRHFVLCGDYNIAHTAIDLAHPKENEGNAGYLPEERAWMDAYTGAGFVDTFRSLHPDEKGAYTWWSYRMRAREKNVGWRIDYHCVDPAFFPSVKASVIRPLVLGSDHCPIELFLEGGAK